MHLPNASAFFPCRTVPTRRRTVRCCPLIRYTDQTERGMDTARVIRETETHVTGKRTDNLIRDYQGICYRYDQRGNLTEKIDLTGTTRYCWSRREKMKLYLYKFLVFMMIFYLMPESVLATSDSQNKALVYYQPFDTELYAPLSEDSIGEGICKYTIDEDVFINLFLSKESNRQLSLDYTHGNIIAKIIMPGEYKVFYFISREGIVRSVDDFFVIDKEKFQRSLVFVSCPDLEFFNKVLNIEFSYPKHFNLWIVGSDENSIKLLDATLVPLSYTKTGKLTKIIFDSKIAIEIDGIKIESRNSGIYINNEEIGNTSHISIDEYNNIKRDTYIINYQCDDNGLCRKDNFECE